MKVLVKNGCFAPPERWRDCRSAGIATSPAPAWQTNAQRGSAGRHAA